jgi:flavodoxin
MKEKILIAYYSHSGNTEEIANKIRELIGGDIFRIVPVERYPRNYQEVLKQSKVEIENDIRPVLEEKVDAIEQYDIVFIGSPNWYSTIAPPVATFLSEYDLSGKRMIPFITHGGGGVSDCITDIKKMCPNVTLSEGLVISGSRTSTANQKLQEWLREIQMITK